MKGADLRETFGVIAHQHDALGDGLATTQAGRRLSRGFDTHHLHSRKIPQALTGAGDFLLP